MDNSLLQAGILLALPAEPDQPIAVAEIFKRLGVARPSASQRASLSRSLARLAHRGVVVRYYPQRCTQGNGYLWGKLERSTRNSRAQKVREMTGEECREARQRMNWTRHELSTAADVPLWFIAAFEDGRSTPDFLVAYEYELRAALESAGGARER